MNHKFDYRWKLADANFTKDKGKVFSCFACGGGSTMGYKLAGFDVIGCNEIDPRMMDAYIANQHPKYEYLELIQTFKLRKDLPEELYNLDVLDGSPPCSTFSIAGSRENAWGVEKHFREGQQKQVLDTLFFDYIELAKKLRPKVVIGENVKGLLLGNAIEYVSKIYKAFDDAGYYCQHWLLDSEYMGVPQRRERVFFICLRKDLASPFLYQKDLFTIMPKLELSFNEPIIPFSEIVDYEGRNADSKVIKLLWENRKYGDLNQGETNFRLYGKNNNFNQVYVYTDRVCPTLAGRESCLVLYDKPKYLSKNEVCHISTFPEDYNFISNKPHYICGMSVPPVMMAQIASEIHSQWLSKIN
jgi:DNA (cytosine-5)-methyltransferase 1